ncbi:unnamed protein product [marine sediment metagenome]|uniref:Uncharacterized protein n=1 Tax=marine sediment metagenome TaxID=412755 RepID=X0T6G0_9ZZZZ
MNETLLGIEISRWLMAVPLFLVAAIFVGTVLWLFLKYHNK